MSETKKQCRNCVAWCEWDEADQPTVWSDSRPSAERPIYGHCRLKGPVSAVGDEGWPVTVMNDWCMEFAAPASNTQEPKGDAAMGGKGGGGGYSVEIMDNGLVILCHGQPMTPEEVVEIQNLVLMRIAVKTWGKPEITDRTVVDNADQYKGEYVATGSAESTVVVSHDVSAAAAFDMAKQEGVERPVLIYIPTDLERYVC